MATFIEKAAYSVNRVFQVFHVINLFILSLFVFLVVSKFDFEGRFLVLTTPVPGHRLPFTFPVLRLIQEHLTLLVSDETCRLQ